MTLPVPIDQLIVDEVARLLSLIRIDNGYQTDAGLHVLTEESRDDFGTDVISIEIQDDTETLSKQSKRFREGTLAITIDVLIPLKLSDKRAMARKVLWDIRRALSIEPRQLPTGTTGLELGGRRIPPRVDGSQYLYAQQDLSVDFTETQPVPLVGEYS